MKPVISKYAMLGALMALVGGGRVQPIQEVFPTLGLNLSRRGTRQSNHTKKGPGRVHQQGDGSPAAMQAMRGPFARYDR